MASFLRPCVKQISLVEVFSCVARNILKECPFVSARRVPHFASKGSIERLDSAQNLQPRDKTTSLYAYTKIEGFCKRMRESLDESVLINRIFLVISFVSFGFRVASRLLLFRGALVRVLSRWPQAMEAPLGNNIASLVVAWILHECLPDVKH